MERRPIEWRTERRSTEWPVGGEPMACSTHAPRRWVAILFLLPHAPGASIAPSSMGTWSPTDGQAELASRISAAAQINTQT